MLHLKTIKPELLELLTCCRVNPWLKPPLIIDNVRMASPEDIAAMKINAIVGRGSKKDFIDLELLLNIFSLKDIINFYKKKYNQATEFIALKSLLYFADADVQGTPKMYHTFDWEKTKNKIKKEVENFTL